MLAVESFRGEFMRAAATIRGIKASGFTLIELVVTVSLLAIIVTMAVPSFQSIINGNRLTAAVNEAAAIVQSTRMEALRRNRVVEVCPTANPDPAPDEAGNIPAPTCSTAGATGMVAYLPGTPVVVVARYTFPPNVQASFAGDFGAKLTFRPDGFARTTAAGSMVKGAMVLCIPTRRPAENIRRLGIESGSRVTTERLNGNGGCTI